MFYFAQRAWDHNQTRLDWFLMQKEPGISVVFCIVRALNASFCGRLMRSPKGVTRTTQQQTCAAFASARAVADADILVCAASCTTKAFSETRALFSDRHCAVEDSRARRITRAEKNSADKKSMAIF